MPQLVDALDEFRTVPMAPHQVGKTKEDLPRILHAPYCIDVRAKQEDQLNDNIELKGIENVGGLKNVTGDRDVPRNTIRNGYVRHATSE